MVSTSTVSTWKSVPKSSLAPPKTPPSARLNVSRAGQRLGPLDQVELADQVVDGAVALQRLDVTGRRRDEVADLGDQRWHQGADRAGQHQHERERHDRHGTAARHAHLAQPDHRRVEADGQEQRDEDEHEDAERVAHREIGGVREDQAEPADEADQERAAPERPPGLAVGKLVGLRRRVLRARLGHGLVAGRALVGRRGRIVDAHLAPLSTPVRPGTLQDRCDSRAAAAPVQDLSHDADTRNRPVVLREGLVVVNGRQLS